ncbi:Ig-like domain-containing protein, partial [Nitrosomonas sp.]|uniref:Ig-like domain-containing protein n=1 Tax=Nitrosomonas sp. TaxID=42353 RepID=UPI003305C024
MASSTVLSQHINVPVEVNAEYAIAPDNPANFLLAVRKEDISNYSRVGNDLAIQFKDGHALHIQGFFSLGKTINNLILGEDNSRFLVNFHNAMSDTGDGIVETSIIYEPIQDGTATIALLGLLGATGIGIGFAAAGGGNGDHPMMPPPAPTLTITGNGQPVPDGQSTNDTLPTLSGTAKPGSAVTVYDNGQAIGTTPVDSNGNWSFTPIQPLSDGNHSLYAVATDNTGTSEPSSSLTIEIDSIAPATPSIDSVMDDIGIITGAIMAGGSTDDTTPTLSGATEAGATVSIFNGDRLLGTTTADTSGNWIFTPPSLLSEGVHSLTVIATDATGNSSDPSASFTLTIDTTAPTLNITATDLVLAA